MTKRLDITLEQLNNEFAHYDPKSPLRFGQMIWNKYAAKDATSWPELFYAKVPRVAYDMAFTELNLDLFASN